jgi:ferrochelatase
VNMQHTVIPSWYQREGYIKATADLIEKELRNFGHPEQVLHFYMSLLCFYSLNLVVLFLS